MGNNTGHFVVYVDENSGYMENELPRIHGSFSTYEEACRECRFIVEESVREFFDYDNTEQGIFDLYVLYGLTPGFDPRDCGERFNSFEYARSYIKKLIELKPFLD